MGYAKPARLGIDFGTTHTVVALADRRNYPVLAFDEYNAVPSLVAVRKSDGKITYGSDAAALTGTEGWFFLRSFKRMLNTAGPQTQVVLGGRPFLLADLLAGYLSHLREAVYRRSNAGLRKRDPLEVAVSVPANALGSQRFMTIDAFRRAGFPVTTVQNEPSSAAFEYADRYARTLTGAREYIVVYDLGGGTFDSSLLHMAGPSKEVVTTAGVSRLGGDDFDEAILQLVLDKTGLQSLTGKPRDGLLEECRRRKEAVTPATKRFIVDLEALDREPLVLAIDEVFEACHPLVDRTLSAMEPLTGQLEEGRHSGVSWSQVAGIYTVGGASGFPPVYRRLRELFGDHRVRRSAHPFAATAIGLAISLEEGGYCRLSERLTRHFGVWREAEDGRGVSFDVIFSKDTSLPGPADSPLEAGRLYRATHNIGHFRFVECTRLKEGNPAGDLLPWGEIYFPFAPELQRKRGLSRTGVIRLQSGPAVKERYRYTKAGLIEVNIADLESGYTRTFRIPAPGT